jgi:hypothetical protein
VVRSLEFVSLPESEGPFPAVRKTQKKRGSHGGHGVHGGIDSDSALFCCLGAAESGSGQASV